MGPCAPIDRFRHQIDLKKKRMRMKINELSKFYSQGVNVSLCLPTKIGSTNILKAISKLETGENQLADAKDDAQAVFHFCLLPKRDVRSKPFRSVLNPALKLRHLRFSD